MKCTMRDLGLRLVPNWHCHSILTVRSICVYIGGGGGINPFKMCFYVRVFHEVETFEKTLRSICVCIIAVHGYGFG